MILLIILGCSRTKDTFTSRTYHQMVSRFNPLFNGDQALLKGKKTLEDQHKDDFDEILSVYKYGSKESVPAIIPDMDKAVEKGSKVIQQHSMKIRNDQKNNYIDDSYLLIGKARFYKREYLPALETFNYAIQEFPKSEVYPEAKLWAAKTESALGNYLGAKEKFDKLYRDPDLPKNLRADAFASYAQLEINQKNYTAGYQLLEQAVDKTREREQEIRWLYIMGQLQSNLGNDYEASELFRRVIKKGPPYELLFMAQLNRAKNYDVDLQNPDKVFDDLEKMLRDDKNYDNRDQIYYVMAEVAEKMDDEALMTEYLKKSIEVSTTNATQKALSYLKLAETNFTNKMYTVAAAYYDSASTSLPPSHERYKELETKKESLAGLVENLKIIETQDSLLMMAGLTEKQRKTKIENMLARQREQEEEAKRRQENQMFNAPTGDNSIAGSGQSAIQGGQWYFYNQNLRSTGVRNFLNTFGNRELEDDWRRKEKKRSFDSNEWQAGSEENADGNADGGGEVASAGEKVEDYLKGIPSTPEEIDQSHRKIVKAYMEIGTIYKNELKDLYAAEKQLKELLERYPDLEEKGRVWYTLYRINGTAGDEKEEQYYRDLILNNLPDSEYASLIKGEKTQEEGKHDLAIAYYKETYKAFKSNEYRESVNMADSGVNKYSETSQAPQFMLIKAYALGYMGEVKPMKETLNGLMAAYPGSEQAKEAEKILARLNVPEETTTASGEKEPEEEISNGKYKSKSSEEHKYIVVVPNSRGLVNNVTIDIIDFNKKFFKNLNLNAKPIYISAEEQMVLVSGLPNEQKAMQYYELILQEKLLDKNLNIKEVKHFVISNSNFTTFYRDKDFQGYLDFFSNQYL